MARISNNNTSSTGVPRSSEPTGNTIRNRVDNQGNVISESHRDSSTIRYMIINSDTYKQALELFSSLNDSSWLNKLLLIPDSFADAEKNILDNVGLGLSTQYHDKQQQSYQDAMLAIRKLVSDYYEHVNSLPITQVQQFADAGINSAITGNGVTGSELSSDIPTQAPVTVSPSPVSSLFELGNFIVSATSGFADLAIKFKDLGLRSKRQEFDITKGKVDIVSDLNKYIRENGIVGDPITWNDIISGDSAKKVYKDAKGSDIALSHILNYGLSRQKYDSLFSHLSSEYPDLVNSYFPVSFEGLRHSGQQGVYFDSVGIDATSDALYKLYKLDKDHEVFLRSYQRELSEGTADLTTSEVKRTEYQDSIRRYEANRAIIMDDLISTLYESDNPADRALLMKILLQHNYLDLGQQATDMIGDVVGSVTGVKNSFDPVKPQ